MRRRSFDALVLTGVATTLFLRSVIAAPIAVLPFSSDLQRDASRLSGSRLVVVLFSLPDCPYCETIRREQLLPLSREPQKEKQLVVREVSITGARAFADFDGRMTKESDFARRSAAKFSPTVAFFGPSGEQVSEPIVGALLADFYGAYLDKAVLNGLSKIEGAHR